MSGKIYYIRDLDSLRHCPDTECLQNEPQEPEVKRFKSIFAPNNIHFNMIVSNRSLNKRFSSNQGYFSRSNRVKKNLSVQLPYISKEQGTTISLGPLSSIQKALKPEPIVKNSYLIKYTSMKNGCRQLDLSPLVAKGYRKFI
ncbi:hypothetical protein SteCoe_31265 [Stentor coeruleus]|uniref:Uncharacterized protein n=1 Tax=Stentor coeruleus TaxID=5963 RepID=A0A1R2B1Q0_9CILI|nr:hypothetical protein SteCoe_31265 [Stentor coeruleus]